MGVIRIGFGGGKLCRDEGDTQGGGSEQCNDGILIIWTLREAFSIKRVVRTCDQQRNQGPTPWIALPWKSSMWNIELIHYRTYNDA